MWRGVRSECGHMRPGSRTAPPPQRQDLPQPLGAPTAPTALDTRRRNNLDHPNRPPPTPPTQTPNHRPTCTASCTALMAPYTPRYHMARRPSASGSGSPPPPPVLSGEPVRR